MTMTIKLAPEMERALRLRSTQLGKPASTLMREALTAYLNAPVPLEPSAYALGEDLFGKHHGAPDLASHRKSELLSVWEAKRQGKRMVAPRGG